MSEMTTYYNQVPTLAMRSRAAELVILGRVGAVVETAVEYHDGSPYVRTTFEVDVEEVLKGEPHDGRVAVRVLGGEDERAETRMLLPVRDGVRMVLMLSDAGKEHVWVPYLGSAFVVEESRVLLGEHAADKLGAADATEVPVELDLDELRRIVVDAVQTEAEAPSVSVRAELPPVTEQPDDHDAARQPDGLDAAGQPGAPDPAPAGDEASP